MDLPAATATDLPGDYGRRIKGLRGVMGLTQSQLAELIGVSYASVNRWENGQARPNRLAWRRIVELESGAGERGATEGIAEAAAAYDASPPPPRGTGSTPANCACSAVASPETRCRRQGR